MSFKKSFGQNELYEICNIHALKYLVKNWKLFEGQIVKPSDNDYDYDPKKLCDKFVKGYTKCLLVKYSRSNKYPSKTGRWFCKNGVGIQSLPRIIRHTICDGLYIDLDFKNCHPCILEQLCKKNDIPTPYLSAYIENRDMLLDEWSGLIQQSKDDTKQVFLSALNGNKMCYNIPDWENILKEFKTIHKTVAELPVYKIVYEEVSACERDNVFAKTVNRVLCDIECECLTSLYKCLDKRNAFQVSIDGTYFKVCPLIFDGLQLPSNKENEAYCNEDNFKNLSFNIESDTGYKLVIVRKPFDNKLPLPETYEEESGEEFVIENDADAGEHIFNKYRKYMKTCDNEIYVKFNDVWTRQKNIVKSALAGWINETPILYEVGDKRKFYNRDENKKKKCISWMLDIWTTYIPDEPKFIEDVNTKSVGYIPFKNFIYCVKTKKTFKYDECDIQFTAKISRNFPVRNLEALKLLMEKVIEPCLPDEEERAYYLYRLARALSGYFEDKKWILNKGSRNCGKGVLGNLLNLGFGALIGAFNANVFVKKKFQNPDDAKALSWVVGVKDKRLIISNEIDEDATLNGSLMKMLSSGGDSVVGRTNGVDEISFTPQFTMMINCNDLKEITPADTYETCEQFIWKRQFVDKSQLIEGQDFLREADPTIKTFIRRDDIIDVFTLLVLDSYADSMALPVCVVSSKQQLTEDIPLTLENIVIKHFVKTNKADDKLFTKDITEIIKKCADDEDFPVNPKKLSCVLLKIGALRPKCGMISINNEKATGYTNIIYIPPKPPPKESEESEESDGDKSNESK